MLHEQFDDAIKFAEKTKQRLGFVSSTFESLLVISVASTNDLHTSTSQIRELVDDPNFDHKELDWDTIARAVCVNEYDKQGPDGILDTVKFFTSFSIAEVESAIANALIFIFINRSSSFGTCLKEWEYVLPKIKNLLEHVPECELPVEFLQTGVRYLGHGDEEALLALPLELRELLEEQASEKEGPD